jgi:hypothetical protein
LIHSIFDIDRRDTSISAFGKAPVLEGRIDVVLYGLSVEEYCIEKLPHIFWSTVCFLISMQQFWCKVNNEHQVTRRVDFIRIPLFSLAITSKLRPFFSCGGG